MYSSADAAEAAANMCWPPHFRTSCDSCILRSTIKCICLSTSLGTLCDQFVTWLPSKKDTQALNDLPFSIMDKSGEEACGPRAKVVEDAACAREYNPAAVKLTSSSCAVWLRDVACGDAV